jgi:hypothetical protein
MDSYSADETEAGISSYRVEPVEMHHYESRLNQLKKLEQRMGMLSSRVDNIDQMASSQIVYNFSNEAKNRKSENTPNDFYGKEIERFEEKPIMESTLTREKEHSERSLLTDRGYKAYTERSAVNEIIGEQEKFDSSVESDMKLNYSYRRPNSPPERDQPYVYPSYRKPYITIEDEQESKRKEAEKEEFELKKKLELNEKKAREKEMERLLLLQREKELEYERRRIEQLQLSLRSPTQQTNISNLQDSITNINTHLLLPSQYSESQHHSALRSPETSTSRTNIHTHSPFQYTKENRPYNFENTLESIQEDRKRIQNEQRKQQHADLLQNYSQQIDDLEERFKLNKKTLANYENLIEQLNSDLEVNSQTIQDLKNSLNEKDKTIQQNDEILILSKNDKKNLLVQIDELKVYLQDKENMIQKQRLLVNV